MAQEEKRINNMRDIKYLFDGISLSPTAMADEAIGVIERRMKKSGIPMSGARLYIAKKSVDARRKDDIKLIYSVCASFGEISESTKNALLRLGARDVSGGELTVDKGHEKMSAPPLVVGMGPAGMFCALILAENGYKPIIIDRGDNVEDRVAAL